MRAAAIKGLFENSWQRLTCYSSETRIIFSLFAASIQAENFFEIERHKFMTFLTAITN